jgi:phage-related protein
MPFGGTIKLTGESEYRKAIQQITQDLSKMSNSLKSQTADFSANDKSLKNSAQASKELNESLKTQSDALAKAKTSYAQYSVAVQAQTTRHNALSKEYRNAVLELERIKATSGETSEEYKKQAQVVDKLGQELAESTEELNESKSAMSALKKEINDSQKTINTTEKAMDDLGTETEEAGKSAEKAGDGFTVMKGVLANLATQAINACISGLKNLGGAFVDVGKQALNSYGEFEQLEGGVNKLFGDDASKTVMENAQKAFSTAGMNANQYMETVTSFSASLISGLNGDTAKAAQISDKAIRDMSDNANTFGTDITSIQNAYQGFAKGNFTMLDNLKLGYGGTKEEMLRLVKDAGVVEDSVESIDDVSFDQIIEAINLTQTRMGITGTTAKEASATIQGSTASMKSAWQNMLTGMADENANFEQLASDFVGTLITEDGQGGVLGTIVPRIATVITGMSTAIQTMLPQLIQAVVPIIQQNLPIIMTAVQGALQTILQVLPQVIPIIADLIPQIVSTLVGLLPDIINAGIQILLGLIQGISDAIPDLIAMLPEIIATIVDVLIQNLPLIIDTGMELLVGLIEGLAEAIPKLIDYIPQIISTIVTVLINNLPKIIDSAVKIMVALINGLIQSLPKLIAMTPRIIMTIVSTLIQNLPQIIQGGVQIIASLISGLVQSLGNLLTNAKKIGSTILQAIADIPKKMIDTGVNLVKGIWQGITGSLDWIKSKIRGWVGNVTGFIKRLFGINSPSKLFRDEIGTNLALGIGEGFSDEMKAVSQEMGDAIPKSFDVETSINSVAGARASANTYDNMVGAFKEALSQMKIELDDEVAGKFIDQTVTRLIYT